MSNFKAKMHQIQCRLGLCPRPRWGAYSAPPDCLAGFKGAYFKGEGRGGEGRGREERGGERGGEGRKGRGAEGTGGKGSGHPQIFTWIIAYAGFES